MFALLRRMLLIAALGMIPLSVFIIGWPALLGVSVVAYGYHRQQRRWNGGTHSHGSAAFASPAQLQQSGMTTTRDGLLLGVSQPGPPPQLKQAIVDVLTAPLSASAAVCDQYRAAITNKPWGGGQPVMIPRRALVHTAIFAGSGAGKSAGLVIPNLLCWSGPVLVLDVKGELYQTVAEYRQTHFGRRQVRLDPYSLCGPGADTFNPLSFIRKGSPTAPEEALALADALVVRAPDEREPHWSDLALSIIFTFLLLAVDIEGGDLPDIAASIAKPEYFEQAKKIMLDSGAFGGALAQAAGLLGHLHEREKASALTTALRHLRFTTSPSVSNAIRTSSFDPLELREGADLYMVIPPTQMKASQGLVRFWLTAILRRLCSGQPDESQDILVILDEAAQLGALPIVEEMVTLLRGWGIRCVFVYQSLGQLQQCFPNGQHLTFLSNMSTRVFFGVNDLETGKFVSESLGQATVLSESAQQGYSYSRSQSKAFEPNNGQSQQSWNWSDTSAEHGRALLTPEEVLGLPRRLMIAMTNLAPPVLVDQVRYYEVDFTAQEPRPRRSSKLINWLAILAIPVMIGWWISAQTTNNPWSSPSPSYTNSTRADSNTDPIPKTIPTPEIPRGRSKNR